jgi:hypothetical protein
MQKLLDLEASFDSNLTSQHDHKKLEFTLDSSYEQLVEAFSCVRIYRQENNLRITQIEPPVDYVLSSVTLGVLEERRKAFQRFLNSKF